MDGTGGGAAGVAARVRWPALGAALVVVVAAALPVWILLSVPLLPTHDGPQHVYAAWLLNHAAELGWVETWLARNGDRVTSFGFDWFFRPLERWLPWRVATQLALAGIAALWTVGLAACAGWGRERSALRWAWLLAVPTALPWMLFMGYFNYLAGLALVPWVWWCTLRVLEAEPAAGTAVRRWGGPGRWAWLVAITTLMAATAVAHVFASAVAGLGVLCMVTAHAAARRTAGLWLQFALPAAPAAWVAVQTWQGSARSLDNSGALAAGERMELAMATLAGGPLPLSPWLLGVAVAGGVAGLVARDAPWRRGLGLAALWMAAGHVWAPFNLPGWDAVGPRFGLPAVLAGAACLSRWPAGGFGRVVRAAAVAVMACSVASVVAWAEATRVAVVALYGSCEAALAPLTLPVHTRLGFVGLASCGESLSGVTPLVRWLANADAVHAIDHGSLPDMYNGYRSIHAFLGRADRPRVGPISDWAALDAGAVRGSGTVLGPPADQPRDWLELSAYLAWAMAQRDLTVVYAPGGPPVLQGMFPRGFEAVAVRDGVWVARYLGCEVTVAATPVPGGPLVGTARFFPYEQTVPLAGGATDEGGVWRMRVPCGPVGVTLVADVDGDGQPSVGEPRCVDGAARELLRTIPPGRAARVDCRLGAVP